MKESSEAGWGSWARWRSTFTVAWGSAVALPSTSSPLTKSSASAVLSVPLTSLCLQTASLSCAAAFFA